MGFARVQLSLMSKVSHHVRSAQFILASSVSALIALLPLVIVVWMTSGSWSPGHVRLQDLTLVFPLLVATKLGLGHVPSLVACFLAYWVVAFVLVAWYVRDKGLELRRGK